MPKLNDILKAIRNEQAAAVKRTMATTDGDDQQRQLQAAIWLHEAATKIESVIRELCPFEPSFPRSKRPEPKASKAAAANPLNATPQTTKPTADSWRT